MQAKSAFSRVAVAAALVAASAGAAATTVIYADDFDGNQTVAMGVTGSLGPFTLGTAAGGPYNGSNGKTWNGSFLMNQSPGNPAAPTFISLGGLGAHTQVTLDFMLGFLDSWDSTNGSVSPDFFEVWVDGVMIGQLTTATASGNVSNFGGGTQIVNDGQIDASIFFSDDLVDMGTAGFLTVAHSASTINVQFRASGRGWQGATDEFWGIDSIRITSDEGATVPEPAPLALLAVAGLAAGWSRRRAR